MEELVCVKLAYDRMFHKKLEDDIKHKTTGHLQRIYRSLLMVGLSRVGAATLLVVVVKS
jgi:hypothetical protein